ncbi:MAG: Monocarboxylate 2-oxoacid-binding periplasmic protein [Alphaproteobacteria bacterium MarineAlpha12_Bin1]|nr:MAG: Monocarboxylate 2-oxoacid-binding periplasmic protein [Alphaproteobacteria bacterium MarineAlpha12_Bin1]|tara:strand:+ start:392 stop:1441 length:1050 start_codon:yes stop_codon:yes gene_type:complete
MRTIYLSSVAIFAIFGLLSAELMLTQSAKASEVDGPKVKWDVSLWGKKRAFTAGVEKLSALVKSKTGGNFNIVLHYGGALSKSRENLDGISIDAFQAAMFCNFYHPKKNPALMSLTMPFLPMSSWENNRKIRDAVYAHPAVKKELAKWNAMAYTSSYLPQYEFLGRGKPPVTLSDWKGLTVRAGGGVGRAMKVIGATPTSSTATEVYTGVQQGTMDAASFPFTYSHVAYKIHEVTQWFTSNLSPGTSDCPVVFSINAYKKLPNQYQKLLMDVKEDVIKAQIQSYIDIDKKNLPMLKAKLKEVKFSKDELAKFRAAAGKPVIDKWIAENQGKFDARGVIDTIFAAVGRKY